MNTHTKKHRHILFAPIALLIFGYSQITGLKQSTHAELMHSAADTRSTTIVQNETKETVQKISEGSYTITAIGYGNIQVENMTVALLNGSIQVVLHNHKLTVVSITSPVAVSDTSGETIYIPYKHQQSIVSTELLQEQIVALPTKVSKSYWQTTAIDLQRSHTNTKWAGIENSLTTKDTTSKTSTQYKNIIIQNIQSSIQQNDVNQLTEIVQSCTDTALINTTCEVAITNAISISTLTTEQVQVIMPYITARPVVLALSQLHPSSMIYSWTYNNKPDMKVIAVFPLSFIHTTNTQDILPLFQKAVSDALLRSINVSKDIESIVQSAELIFTADTIKTYPNKARQLQKVLQTVLTPYESIITNNAAWQKIVKDTTEYTTIIRPNNTKLKSPETIELQENIVGILSSSEIIEKAHDILRQANAMYSIHTSIIAKGTNTACIENIVFAGKTKDYTLSFTLQVKSGEVANIHIENTAYPNTMWIEDFVSWIHSI